MRFKTYMLPKIKFTQLPCGKFYLSLTSSAALLQPGVYNHMIIVLNRAMITELYGLAGSEEQFPK